MEKARWTDGFRCPRCDGHEHELFYGRRLKRYQCRICSHQATLTRGKNTQPIKLPFTTWIQAFYLIGQAKNDISSLELRGHMDVKYDATWLLHNKILRAMTERDDGCVLRGKIQIDAACLGRERPGDKAGRGSENMIPIVAALSVNEAGHPVHTKINSLAGFSSVAIATYARDHLAPGNAVLSDGLTCFRSITAAGCSHEVIVNGGKHPNYFPQFRWINTVLRNLKTCFSVTFHAFNIVKYARRHLGGHCFGFNSRFSRAAMTERIPNAVCCCNHFTERDLCVAEAYC